MAFQFTLEQKQVMAQRYMTGVRLKELAEEFKTSIPTMAKFCRDGGASIRRPGKMKYGSGEDVKVIQEINEFLAHKSFEPVSSLTLDENTVVPSESPAVPVRKILAFE